MNWELLYFTLLAFYAIMTVCCFSSFRITRQALKRADEMLEWNKRLLENGESLLQQRNQLQRRLLELERET